jgi:hypothetical protein
MLAIGPRIHDNPWVKLSRAIEARLANVPVEQVERLDLVSQPHM